MARGGRGGGLSGNRKAIDLVNVMTAPERTDLGVLVNTITEKMLKDISDIFDSPPLTPVSTEQEHHHWLSRSILHLRNENVPPHLRHKNKKKDGPQYSEAYKKAHDLVEKEEGEAMSPQLQELKKESLLHFKKWQTSVLLRFTDLTVSEPALASRGKGRGGRGGGRGDARGRGGRGGGVSSTPRAPQALGFGPPRAPSNAADRQLARRHPPVPNHLWNLPEDKRKVMLHIAFLLLLSMSEYTPNSRLLLLNLCSSLNLPLQAFQADEVRLARGLAQTALEVPESEEAAGKAPEEIGRGVRKWKATLGSNQVPACPVLSPALLQIGVGTPRGGMGLPQTTAAALLGPMSDNGRLMGTLFGMNAARPAGKSLETFAREIQDFALLPLHGQIRDEYKDARDTRAQDRRLRIVLGIAGWKLERDEPTKPWECLGHQAESYAMRWELNTLINLGSALETVIKSSAWSSAVKEIKTRTIFSTIMEQRWPVSLLKVSKIIDNPWSVGMVRAEKTGAVLADALMRGKFQGDRPVSLIGFGLAARAIYICLMILAERRNFGLIESVVLMGLPAPSESRVWLTLKSVVAGRLVNVYSDHDYILGFLYRTSNIHFGLAGLQDIQGAVGVENHRVKLPKGHLSYQYLIPNILKDIGWEDVDMKAVRTTASPVMPLKPMSMVQTRVDGLLSAV